MHKIPSILHVKPTFSILHTNFYKTPTSIYLFYTFIQQNIHFFFIIFYYSPSPPLSLIDQHSLTYPDADPTLSHKPRPNTQRLVFLFDSSTQTQPFLLLIFFISCLVGEKVVEKSKNRRKDDQQHFLTNPDPTRKEK